MNEQVSFYIILVSRKNIKQGLEKSDTGATNSTRRRNQSFREQKLEDEHFGGPWGICSSFLLSLPLSFSPSLPLPLYFSVSSPPQILIEHAFCIRHININSHKNSIDLFYPLHFTDSKTDI